MRNGTFYLNNNGSRWVHYINGQKEKRTFVTKSEKTVTRTIIFYESFGNFVSCRISYKGKLISVFADSILED